MHIGEHDRRREGVDIPADCFVECLSDGVEVVSLLDDPVVRGISRTAGSGRELIDVAQRAGVAEPPVAIEFQDVRGLDVAMDEVFLMRRLREAVQSLRSAEGGFIVRTACEGLTKKEIQDDMKFLLKLWGRITKKREQHSAPALVHDDMDVILRIIRDLFTPDINEIIIDNASDYERINEFIATFMPRLIDRVKLHDQPTPIFEHHKVEQQITKAALLSRTLQHLSCRESPFQKYLAIDQVRACKSP